ncbi:MAG: hypothetical protein KDD44_07555, partial [Bdellovibrionales bacterium]|nr:hypothetical protein [Bdellovibrionales bacterium]
AAVRVAGQVTGMNTIAEAAYYDGEADRQALRTERRLQEKVENKLAEQIGAAGRLDDEVQALAKDDSPEARAAIAEKREAYEKIVSQMESEQRRLDQRGLVDQNDPGLAYLRNKMRELPSDIGYIPEGGANGDRSQEQPATPPSSTATDENTAATERSASTNEAVAAKTSSEIPTSPESPLAPSDGQKSAAPDQTPSATTQDQISAEAIARRSKTRSGDPSIEIVDPTALQPTSPAQPSSSVARTNADLPARVRRQPEAQPALPRGGELPPPPPPRSGDDDLFAEIDNMSDLSKVRRGTERALAGSASRLRSSRAAASALQNKVRGSLIEAEQRSRQRTEIISREVERTSMDSHRSHVREVERERRREERLRIDRERRQARQEQSRREAEARRAREAATRREQAAARRRQNWEPVSPPPRRPSRPASPPATTAKAPQRTGPGRPLGSTATHGLPSGGPVCIYGVVGPGC